jgi:hypothetical protein
MPTNVRIGLLALGALLLLAALVTGLLKRGPRAASVLLAVCGAGLLAWGLAQQLLSPARPSSPSSKTAATAASTQGPARPDLTLVASSAFSDCSKPAEPGTPPDGTSASRAQMLAAQQEMKAYDAATTAYTQCVDAAAQHIVEQYQDFVPASEVRAVRELDVKVHNAAVDQDQVLVNRFNQQLRIFQGKQGP